MTDGSARTEWRLDAALAAATAVAVLGIVAVLMRLWEADLRIPFATGTDALFGGAVVKGLIEGGSFTANRALGLPGTLQTLDFPAADALNYLGLWVVGALTRDWAVAMNVFYLLTYPFAAAAAVLAGRRMGISRPASVGCAVLFALLPYHWMRGEGHLLLASYWLVPPTVLVALWVAGDAPPLLSAPGGRRGLKAVLTRPRAVAALAVCALVSSAGVYYAFFGGFLVLVAGTWAAARERRWARLLPAVVLCGVIAAGALANVVPTMVFIARNGSNPGGLARNPGQAEVYGLKIDQLFLPIDGHRIGMFARLKALYREGLRKMGPYMDNEGVMSSLGIVGAVGFLISVLLALLSPPGAVRRRREDASGGGLGGPSGLGLLSLCCVLLATVGGFGALAAASVLPQIRSYNRISVFIGFLSLAAMAMLWDRLRDSRHGRMRMLAWPLLALAVIGGVLDQTPATLAPAYAQQSAVFAGDAAYIARIEASLPAGSAVLQLPYMPFPEPGGPQFGMSDYEPMRAYLHSTTLRWSYGAMKGREADAWQKATSALPVPEMVAAARAKGFDGVWVQRNGYEDGGAAVTSGLRRVLGSDPIVSPDGVFEFWTL